MIPEIENLKVKFTEKNHNPIYLKTPNLQDGCVVKASNDDFNKSIVIGEKGKVHFEEVRGQYNDSTFGKRMVKHLEYSETYRFPRRTCLQPKTKIERDRHYLRHFDNPIKIAPDVSFLPSPYWQCKKHINPNESKLYELENDMNRKKRVNSLDEKRNGIPESSKGDKFYKQADREPGFYEKGGLIPGSTIQLRQRTKMDMRKSEDLTRKANTILLTSMPYSEKVKLHNLNTDIEDVRCLNVS